MILQEFDAARSRTLSEKEIRQIEQKHVPEFRASGFFTTLSAIALVAVVALALRRGGLDVLRDSRRVELVSYGLIALIGLGMLAVSIASSGAVVYGVARRTACGGSTPTARYVSSP